MADYHAHYLTHEMMHTIQNTLESDVGRWIWEALAEYDAYLHTTIWNRQGGINNLLELTHYSDKEHIIYGQSLDGREYLMTEKNEAYVGGTVIMLYLAERFGESIHKDLLMHPMSEILEERGATVAEEFDGLVSWFWARPEHQTYERCR